MNALFTGFTGHGSKSCERFSKMLFIYLCIYYSKWKEKALLIIYACIGTRNNILYHKNHNKHVFTFTNLQFFTNFYNNFYKLFLTNNIHLIN